MCCKSEEWIPFKVLQMMTKSKHFSFVTNTLSSRFFFNSTNFFSVSELFQSIFVFVRVSSSGTKVFTLFDCSMLTTFGINIV